MMFSGDTYETQGTGKKITGLAGFPSFIQPEEILISIWVGIHQTTN